MVAENRPLRDLRPLFDPRALAIVGASAHPAKWGYWLAQSALLGRRRRAVYLVNRNGGEILGQPAYRSLADLPETVELVILATPANGFAETVDGALAAGARAIVAITAGLGELGAQGRAIEEAAVARARRAGAVLVGPNCLGVADTGTELNVAFQDFRPGPVGLISQSGNLALELALRGADAGVGFSRFVSVGNQADLGPSELIRNFTIHEPTRVIALYVEDFGDGRELARAAQRAHESGKPVLLLTVGSSQAGARAARSHTGALVSGSAAVDAACRASGTIRVATPQELIDVAQALLSPSPIRGRRVAVVGDGGGHVALAADLLTAHGFDLPTLSESLQVSLQQDLPATATTRNPVDLAGGGEEDFHTYARCVDRMLASGEVDSVILTGYFGGYSDQSAEFAAAETEVAREMVRSVNASGRGLVVQTMYPRTSPSLKLRESGVPVYSDIAAAVRAMARACAHAIGQPTGVPDLPPPIPIDQHDGYFAARALIAEAGIPVIAACSVRSVQEAVTAAASLGYPVVLKALASSHKSDQSAVRLNVRDAHELRSAVEDMRGRLNPATFSVERMAPLARGVELLVGVRWDRGFGPVVVAGLGGVFAETLQDVAVALAPVVAAEAQGMLRSLRGAPLLFGSRGQPPLDVSRAASAIAALSSFGAARPALHEIEVNPLLVLEDGVLALDARVGLGQFT